MATPQVPPNGFAVQKNCIALIFPFEGAIALIQKQRPKVIFEFVCCCDSKADKLQVFKLLADELVEASKTLVTPFQV